MKLLPPALCIAALLVPLAGQQRGELALGSINDDYAAAFNAKDAARVASFYTDDGELMAPGASMFKGRESIELALHATFVQGGTLALQSLDSQVLGDRAFDSGAFSVTLPGVNDHGQPEVISGRYITVFYRTSEGWKMQHHIFHVQVSEADSQS